jgi:hypothetical protein
LEDSITFKPNHVKKLKAFFLTAIFFFAVLSGVKAQCKYEYQEKDVITGKLTFQTKRFVLSKQEKKKELYDIRNIRARLGSNGSDPLLFIEFMVYNGYGKMLMLTSGTDSLLLKFEDGTVESAKINKAPTITANQVGALLADISYPLTASIIQAFEKGLKVSALRITTGGFNIDVASVETDLAAKFKECWIK